MAVARSVQAFQCIKGEDYIVLWTVQTSETDTTAVDITGWTFALKVKRRDGDDDPSVITPTIAIVTAAAGTVRSTFAAAGTAALDGDYVFSFWRTNAGNATCLATGTFSVADTTQN